MNYHFSPKSENIKTGPIPVIMSDSKTCPDACGFKSGGCYAKFNFLGLHWRNLDKKKIGVSFTELTQKIKNIPQDQIYRLNQAGDLPGINNKINFKLLKRLIRANNNKKVLAYTHKLVLGNSATAKRNRKYIKYANLNGFNLNLSADNLKDADRKANLKIGPVTVVVPSNSPNTLFTPKGRKVVICPAQYRDLTCKNCKLCSTKRTSIIGFRAHSTGKNIVNKIVKN